MSKARILLGALIAAAIVLVGGLSFQFLTGSSITARSGDPPGTAMMRSGLTEEQLAANTAQIPIGRMAEPRELAGTVLFLASDHAGYITGATINVSGGWLMY